MPAIAQNKARVETQFQNWLEKTVWPDARKRGVSRRTFEASLSSVPILWKLPDLVAPGSKPKRSRPQAQAEFRSPTRYFNEKSLSGVVGKGRSLATKHSRLLKKIERLTGVPGGILLAVWGRESGFGRAKIPYDVFSVLATKGFMSTRKALFYRELLAALEIIEKGYASRAQMKSSWAGAMGQPQFLPTSYLEYAVDFDGDGKRDIWNSVPDTLASIANYLSKKGWQKGRDWGFEVTFPQSVSCALEGPDRMQPISDWEQAGVERISGRPFPRGERRLPASLLMPAGRMGPGFLATPNFYVIKEYNNSDLYALFVGHVADRISYTNRPLRGAWRDVPGLKRGNVMAIQERLEREGKDVGGVDGLAGFKTRREIGAWQERNALDATCFPSLDLARRMGG